MAGCQHHSAGAKLCGETRELAAVVRFIGDKLKITKKAISATLLAAGLVFTGVTAAHAGTTYSSFTANMPKLQQAWNSGSQSKATSKAAGNVRISSVASSYTANARMCLSQNHNSCGTEVKGINDGGSASLANSFGSGTSVVLQLHENPWAAVDVTATGSWRSN